MFSTVKVNVDTGMFCIQIQKGWREEPSTRHSLRFTVAQYKKDINSAQI